MTTTALDDQFAVCTPEEDEAFQAMEARQRECAAERVQESQRERFEAWAKTANLPLSESKIIGVGVTYKYATTEAAWRGFQAACPEGWQAVPKRADDSMKLAGWKMKDNPGDSAHQIWNAMRAAAPKPEDV